MKRLFLGLMCICFLQVAYGQAKKIDDVIPVRGLAIAAPSVQGLDLFLKFIEEELAPAHFNMLVLRVDWNYAYESHPELRRDDPLSRADVKRIVDLCKKYDIKIAPQINLLGHQGGARPLNLLRVYPEFEESPHITEAPSNTYVDGLYQRSYCPLHPEVHNVVFALVDELMDVFEAEWFHAGMDEVYHLGDERCPRCRGLDKADLFAGEVTRIHNHLAIKNRRLMIWGARLIDGISAGVGAWEGSYNNTYRAIDMIPKDVYICDWHYNRADLTNVYFAIKGFDVVSCPWNRPEVAAKQLEDMINFRQQSSRAMAPRFQGLLATVWSGADGFLRSYYDPETYVVQPPVEGEQNNQTRGGDARTVKLLIEEFKQLNQ